MEELTKDEPGYDRCDFSNMKKFVHSLPYIPRDMYRSITLASRLEVDGPASVYFYTEDNNKLFSRPEWKIEIVIAGLLVYLSVRNMYIEVRYKHGFVDEAEKIAKGIETMHPKRVLVVEK